MGLQHARVLVCLYTAALPNPCKITYKMSPCAHTWAPLCDKYNFVFHSRQNKRFALERYKRFPFSLDSYVYYKIHLGGKSVGIENDRTISLCVFIIMFAYTSGPAFCLCALTVYRLRLMLIYLSAT